MTEQSYFQLISPLIFLVFAGGLFMLYTFERRLISAKIFGFSYLFGAAAVTLEFFRAGIDPILAAYLSNTFYSITTILFAVAAAVRYRQKVPTSQMAIVTIALFVGIAYFLHIEPSIAARTIVANGGNGIIFFLAAHCIYQGRQLPIDKVFAWVVGAFAFQFFIRALLTISFFHETLTNANYASSMTALSMQFIVSIAALCVAACLFFSFGLEVFGSLKREAETDHLTSLLNRRGLKQKFLELRERSIRASVPVALVVCDIDHFKMINDAHGHGAGDKVIQKLSSIIDETARKTDLTARIGGEEFCIVLWNANSAAAKLFAENLRSAFSAHQFKDLPTITMSCGITSLYVDDNWNTLFERADKALYLAKNTGRDRACVFGDDSTRAEPQKLSVVA